ncbi:MAG: restriction endonuclease subunit S [Gemmatimonadaceae bacterium]
MSNWNRVTIESVCQSIVDCVNKTAPLADRPTPYRMIRTTNIKQGRLDLSDARYVEESTYRTWTRRAVPSKGDVLLTREAPLGEVAIIRDETNVFLGQRIVQYRANPEVLDPRFLYYSFQGPDLQAQIHAHGGSGSTVDHIRVPDCAKFQIALPPLSEQRRVADVLSSLDEKIELNRRMSETLEAMARALFKSWFVDFDPVRAKAEGRETGFREEIAALFPDGFNNSELGEIPRGWATGSILEQAKLLSGGTPKTDRPDYWDGPILWASAKDVSQCKTSLLVSTDRSISRLGLEESATQLVPALATVIVARGATTGRMALVGREMAMNQTCYALVSTTDSPIALYLSLREGISALVNAAHGSVFDTITTSTFASSRFMLPPPAVLRAFDESCSCYFERMLTSAEQAQTLARLRESLLPRLLAGALSGGGSE